MEMRWRQAFVLSHYLPTTWAALENVPARTDVALGVLTLTSRGAFVPYFSSSASYRDPSTYLQLLLLTASPRMYQVHLR